MTFTKKSFQYELFATYLEETGMILSIRELQFRPRYLEILYG